VKSDDPDKPSNAQSAMLDYYDDMLGSLSSDPLQERVQQELAVKVLSSSLNKKAHSPQVSFQQKLVPKPLLPSKKRQAKKLPSTYYKDVYEEKFKAEIVAPLIISAAFPKMAPKKEVEPNQSAAEISITAKDVLIESVVIATEIKEVELEVTKITPKPSIPTANIVSKTSAILISEQAKSNKVVLADKSLSERKQSSILDSNLESQNKDALISAQNNSTDSDSKYPALGAFAANGRPEWAQERFECLLFSVAGLQLAVPLISLGAIYKIESNFTPLVGRASWFMGLYRHDERNIRVVDTAQLVMPSRVDSTTRENYKYIIRLGGNNWGIACDSVQESIQLEPEAVKWRTERSKRAWLSGTVIEHMCALIDVDALTSILKKEAMSKHSSFNG
jgi:purine-binding chemotaxis protein CheW